jgi:predicted lipid-binding transport protein (Tim44 family)
MQRCQRLSNYWGLTTRSEKRFQSKAREPGPRRGEEESMVGAVIGLLVIVAIVLVLLKVAAVGGVLGLIAIILLILLLLGRI